MKNIVSNAYDVSNLDFIKHFIELWIGIEEQIGFWMDNNKNILFSFLFFMDAPIVDNNRCNHAHLRNMILNWKPKQRNLWSLKQWIVIKLFDFLNEISFLRF